MLASGRLTHVRDSAFASAIAMAALACAQSAGAQSFSQPRTLQESMFGSRAQDGRDYGATPPVARYVSEEGATFILDRTGDAALLKFERSIEVWALKPTPAPRGDIIYKNDLGQPVLRVSRLGGLTLFTPQRPTGVPVALAPGAAPSLKPGQLSPQVLLQKLAQASLRASRSAKRLIPFEGRDAAPESAAIMADAASVSAEAIARLSAARDGRRYIDRVKKFVIIPGRRSDARMRAGVVEVTVDARKGVAGRPSSGRVATVIVEGVKGKAE
jgi:hypothetical protein